MRPLWRAHFDGSFFMSKKTFNKPPKTTNQHIDILLSRGLTITDREIACFYLEKIGYYRLSGYFKNFTVNKEHKFESDCNFEQIINLYEFDRELRLLVLDAIERVEIAVRARISNVMSLNYENSHWYTNKRLFKESFNHERLIDTLRSKYEHKDNKMGVWVKKKTQDPIYENYSNKYSMPVLPASWMISESTSLGDWSTIYKYLREKRDRKTISTSFNGLEPGVFQSWLHSITYLRNICAHHNRLWDKRFKITPIAKHSLSHHFFDIDSTYSQFIPLYFLLCSITKHNSWADKLKILFKKFPEINQGKMGFPKKWDRSPFWNLI